MFVYALFIVVIAAVCGVAALAAGLYFAHSMLNLIYPELLERPNVLPHRYHAFWDRECLMPAGKEARARFFVFTFIGIGALVVAGSISAHIDRTEALPGPCHDCGWLRPAAAPAPAPDLPAPVPDLPATVPDVD